MTVDDETDAVGSALREFLSVRLPAGADPEIQRLSRSGTGSSRENWPFDAVWTSDGVRTTHELLLRRDPPATVVDTGRDVEFRLLRALAGTDVPVPEVYWLDEDGAYLDRPAMIVGRHAGSAHRAVLRDVDPLRLGVDGRASLARRMCEVLADLHRVDVEKAGLRADLDDPGERTASYELDRWVRELDDREDEPRPALRLAVAWLRDHLPPPPTRTVLVHGDFRPANVLVDGGRLDVLLDWELAHLGDPLDDLGWYTAPLYAREHLIPGRWEVADFLRAYTDLTGVPVPSAALGFWQVLATFRLAVIALTAVQVFRGGGDRAAAPIDAVERHVLTTILAVEEA